jgi:hypothetical protein
VGNLSATVLRLACSYMLTHPPLRLLFRASGADFKPTAFEDRSRRELDDRLPRRGFGFGDRPGSRDASRDRWERTAPRDGSRDARPHSRDISAEPTWRRAGPALSPSSPPRERPRLNLAPRSAAAPAATTPAGASKASVFGAARPREEVLREQGRDAVKEDLALEHEAVDRWGCWQGGVGRRGARGQGSSQRTGQRSGEQHCKGGLSRLLAGRR